MSAPERETRDAAFVVVPDLDIEMPEIEVVSADPAQADVVVRIPDTSIHSSLATYRRIAALLVGLDALVIVATMAIVASGARFGWSLDAALVIAGAPFVWGAVFHSFGLYAVRHLSAPEEFRRVISATTLGVGLIVVASVWWEGALNRSTLALTWLIALLLELAVRRIVRWRVGRLRTEGRLNLRTLIVGTNDEARTIEEVLEEPVRGFEPIGLVQPSGTAQVKPAEDVLGTIDDLPELIRETSAECVFVASTGVSAADVFLASRACRQANIDMRVSANTREVLTSRVSVQQVHDLMVLAVRSAKLTPTQAAIKRAFDLVLSTIGLIVLAPVMLVVAAIVRLTSAGPVFFRQQRVTKDGRTFTLYKFRTMVVDAERLLDEATISQAYFKIRDDPRLTPIGGFLRSSSLDELPQLWNVIRGDMSLVGPRPLAKDQVEANLELLDPRHEVRAGLTGWWQINGRSELDVQDAVKMDLFYIENWSLTLDVYVLLKTVGVVLLGKGAY
jgi:exopolysaccharide biosynthesis polyprenyl glycosylphosphotransferase